MSFDDTVDLYRAMHENEQEERRERKERRLTELDSVRKAGFHVEALNKGVHLRIRWIDVWPSTGKWHNRKTNKQGRLDDATTLVEFARSQFQI